MNKLHTDEESFARFNTKPLRFANRNAGGDWKSLRGCPMMAASVTFRSSRPCALHASICVRLIIVRLRQSLSGLRIIAGGRDSQGGSEAVLVFRQQDLPRNSSR